MPNLKVGELGEFIRDQRRSAQFSLRQLAEVAGVSNPYLSQIERGLRKPSAETLKQIAKALRISAETLYVQAGILEDREGPQVSAAILADPAITDRQKRVLLDIYDSFCKENALLVEATAVAADLSASAEPLADEPLEPSGPAASPARPTRTAGKKAVTKPKAAGPPAG